MAAKQTADSFEEFIATRSLARFYAWIVAGLVVLYLITFPIFKAPILISVPVAVAGWFYYRKGGILASILAIVINIFLFNRFIGQLSWNFLFELQNGFLLGHTFVVAVSILIGYARGVFEHLFQLGQRLRSQERFLSLSNMIIKKILMPSRPDRLFDDIVNHLTNLFMSDYGYIIRWDPIQKKAFLIAATHSLTDSPLERELDLNGIRIRRVLQTQALFIENSEGTLAIIESLNLTGTSHLSRNAICIPLVAREYKFGIAVLASEAPRHYPIDNQAEAERVGYQIALALWTVRQDEISQQQLNETRTLMQVGQTLSETVRIGLDRVLQQIVDSARTLIPQAQKTVIHLVDSDNVSLIPQAISVSSEERPSQIESAIGDGVAGRFYGMGSQPT
jgi:hypothetical protein